MHPLDGARLKAYRGNKHVQSLHVRVDRFVKEDSRRVLDKYEPQTGRYVRHIIEGVPTPPEWSILLGEVAHNYRSCLDHVAWQLAIAGSPTSNPEDQWKASDISFPLYADRRKYLRKRNSAWRHQGLRPEHRRRLRHVQPYQRTNAPESHPLWHLHWLSNIDKHQVLHTTLVDLGDTMPRPGELSKKILDPVTGEFEMVYGPPLPGIIGAGMEVVLRVGGPSEGDVYFQGNLPLEVEAEQPGTILHEQPMLRLVDAIRTSQVPGRGVTRRQDRGLLRRR